MTLILFLCGLAQAVDQAQTDALEAAKLNVTLNRVNGLTPEMQAQLAAAMAAVEEAKAEASGARSQADQTRRSIERLRGHVVGGFKVVEAKIDDTNGRVNGLDARVTALEEAAAKPVAVPSEPAPPVMVVPPVVVVPPPPVVEEDACEPCDEDVVEEVKPARKPRPTPDPRGPSMAAMGGISVGITHNGGEIIDGGEAVVAGAVSVPLSLYGGMVYGERSGLGVGVVAHGSIDPTSSGTGIGADLLVLKTNDRDGAFGLGLGYAYTGFGSLQGAGANAWTNAGEVLGVVRVPLSNPNKPVVTDLMVVGGVQIGLLGNEDGQVFSAAPTLQIGLGFRRQGLGLAVAGNSED